MRQPMRSKKSDLTHTAARRTHSLKKIFFLTAALLALPAGTPLFAQDTEPTSPAAAGGTDTTDILPNAEETAETKSQKKHSLFFTLGPAVMINTHSGKKSAPSPVMFSPGVGGDFFQDKMIGFSPRLSFFTTYYLWDGEAAHPAEIENRTARVFALLFDLSAVAHLRYKSHSFEAGGGFSILGRFGILANGVSPSDRGGSETGTASDDVSEITGWFWGGARFLYINLTGTWMYPLPNGWKAGVSAYVHIPVGSLAGGDGVNGMLLSLAARLQI